MMTWKEILEKEQKQSYYQDLLTFVAQERKEHIVYPPEGQVFTCFELTPYEKVKVVILGQDPYHQPNQAMGLAFSVQKNQPLPKSLINIFKELETDLGIKNTNGDLSHWAQQGVFMMNTLMTVRESQPMSHQGKGWETFTDKILKSLGEREKPIIFVLWGKKAQDKKHFIESHHYIIESSHPSPLSAYRNFWGSKPFSRINEILEKEGLRPIDWSTHV
ncbi:MAG TPA: uracil-DNA glycosylase [Erysipelothrix sp.]